MPKNDNLDYPWEEPPKPGEAIEIQSGLYWIRMPLPFALDHINLWIGEDDDGLSLIDTGFDAVETQELWTQLFADRFSDKSPSRLICTHHHPDHMGLAGWLTDTLDIPLYTTEKEWDAFHKWGQLNQPALIDLMRQFYRAGDVPENRQESDLVRRTSLRTRKRLEPEGFSAISDGDHLSAGQRNWTVRIGTGHSPELAALYCADDKLLISGDQVLPRISPNVSVMPFDLDANPLIDFLDSLSRFRQLPDDTLVLPSHKLPFYGLHTRIDDLVSHHQDRLDDTLGACARPVTAADVVEVLFPRALNDHQYFFALGETFAHLNYLWHDGALSRETTGGGSLRFVKR